MRRPYIASAVRNKSTVGIPYLSIWNISQETFSERSNIQIVGAICKIKKKNTYTNIPVHV